MPSFIIKADRERDAYIEWSSIVEAPVGIGDRAAFVAEYDEKRLARTDENGTSAMFFDWLPGSKQEGGWDDAGLIYQQEGFLLRDKFGAVFDLLTNDINARVPIDWLKPFEDEEPD